VSLVAVEPAFGDEQLLAVHFGEEVAHGAGLDVGAFEDPAVFAGGGIEDDQVLAGDHEQFGPAVFVDVVDVQVVDVGGAGHFFEVGLEIGTPPDFEAVGAHAAVADEGLLLAVAVNVVEVVRMAGAAVEVAVPEAVQVVVVDVDGVYEGGDEDVAPGAEAADVAELENTVGAGFHLFAVVAAVAFEDSEIAAAVAFGDIDDFGLAVAIDIADGGGDFVHGPVAGTEGCALLPHDVAVELHGGNAVDLLFVAVAAGGHARDVAVAGLEEDCFQLAVAVEVSEAHSGIAETGCIDLVGKTKRTSHGNFLLRLLWVSVSCPTRILYIGAQPEKRPTRSFNRIGGDGCRVVWGILKEIGSLVNVRESEWYDTERRQHDERSGS